MLEYPKDKLQEYIDNSELRVYSANIKVRLSKELSLKYDKGAFNEYLKYTENCIETLKKLNIKNPYNSKPIYYIYIVPVNSYTELLNYPKKFNKGNGGGKPVISRDLDSFRYAFGISDNICENFSKNDINIASYENDIHELSHLIHSIFYTNDLLLDEGFAEALPLYGLDLEHKYISHKEALINLKEKDIYTVEELLEQEENNSFGDKYLLPNKTCSFRLSYISSYLFVRGCIETIEKKFKISKIDSINYFLEMIYKCNFINAWRIFSIADQLGLDKEELYSGKSLQIQVLESIKNCE